MRKTKLRSLRFEFLLLPLALLLALGFSATRLGEELENLTLDWRFQARAAADPPANAKVLVVGIDEDALAKLGRWPWSREVHAQLVTLLATRPPAAAAFDLLFTEPSADPAQDQLFGDALVQSTTYITAAAAETLENSQKFEAEYAGNTKAIANIKGDINRLIGNDTVLLPVPIIAESSHAGLVNSPPGEDGVRRQIPLVVRCGTRVFPSLVLQALLSREEVETDAVEVVLGDSIRIQGTHQQWQIPIDDRGQMTINYRHPNTFKVFPYAGLMASLLEFKDKEWPKDRPPVAGQILFIGQTAAGLADLGPTPHGPQTPLVLTHANALSNILSGDYIKQPDFLQLIGVWALMALLTIIPVRFGPIWLAALVPTLFVGVYVFSAFYLFGVQSLHMPIAWPVFGFVLVEGGSILHRLIIELRAKSRITGMFGTYLAPQVVKQMISSGDEPKLGGQQAEITAFFSDIAGFSSFSEKLTPERLVTLMNDYLSEMTDILQDNGGTLDKFIGDAIVGMFGAPLPYAGHAHSACRAALLMQKRQIELREKWRQEGDWPDIVFEMKTRIGLNSGLAIIGNMGSRRRFNYTMMGDTVNLAARSESGAKSYGVYTMITGETKALAEKHQDDITYRFLDSIVVKGRSKPAEVYELVGFTHEISAETQECLAFFQKGIAAYLSQDWDTAKALFGRSAKREIHQDANPSLVMAERCDDMKIHPPPADWDGVYVMKTK
ncbi:MAG: adenylate/guanylate cyclase domain-containing protein [Prosthecobacter sp.]|uniref:CHASE2 domain-containing protein n=1 Tax=Prosthecobacter sp. TaxID=1965333 RepID=UPI0026348B97|nr:adenylate/guanylate cyclase domain-containing protein [Prosthecobacter sp.]MCF7789032.1 adenylate/guanylate cyclase domain-containing protein [Prosthecobacter sp.]